MVLVRNFTGIEGGDIEVLGDVHLIGAVQRHSEEPHVLQGVAERPGVGLYGDVEVEVVVALRVGALAVDGVVGERREQRYRVASEDGDVQRGVDEGVLNVLPVDDNVARPLFDAQHRLFLHGDAHPEVGRLGAYGKAVGLEVRLGDMAVAVLRRHPPKMVP